MSDLFGGLSDSSDEDSRGAVPRSRTSSLLPPKRIVRTLSRYYLQTPSAHSIEAKRPKVDVPVRSEQHYISNTEVCNSVSPLQFLASRTSQSSARFGLGLARSGRSPTG